jgi:hypothetical protein
MILRVTVMIINLFLSYNRGAMRTNLMILLGNNMILQWSPFTRTPGFPLLPDTNQCYQR